MSWLSEPLQLPFMQHALLAVTLLSLPAGLLGSWITLRGLAFFTHAASTATFPALVIGVAVGLPIQLTALAATLLFTAAVGSSSARNPGKNTAGVAVSLIAALALGAVLVSDVFHSGTGVDQLLFGTILGLGSDDLIACGGVALLVAAVVARFNRQWTASSFDQESAKTVLHNSRSAEWVLLVTVALTVVVCLPLIGSILIGSILITPAATAVLLVKRLPQLYLAAVLFALFDGLCGTLLAYHLNAPAGASIAVTSTVLFIIVAALKGCNGYLKDRRVRPVSA